VAPLLRITPFVDERGETTGAVLSLVDITRLQLAQEAQHYVAAMVESSQKAVIVRELAGSGHRQ
jgi:hypothetical protein